MWRLDNNGKRVVICRIDTADDRIVPTNRGVYQKAARTAAAPCRYK